MWTSARFQVRSWFACLSLLAALLLSACGGGDGSTTGSAQGDGTPEKPQKTATNTHTPTITPTPNPLNIPSNASLINFQAATGDILLETISEEGFCIVNQTTDITAIIASLAAAA